MKGIRWYYLIENEIHFIIIPHIDDIVHHTLDTWPATCSVLTWSDFRQRFESLSPPPVVKISWISSMIIILWDNSWIFSSQMFHIRFRFVSLGFKVDPECILIKIGLWRFFGLLFKIHGSRLVSTCAQVQRMTSLPHGCIFVIDITFIGPIDTKFRNEFLTKFFCIFQISSFFLWLVPKLV